jgi:hypothetical protein
VSTTIARMLAGVAAFVGLSALLLAAPAPGAVFGVGVLRRDGIILPFAAFDGKKWSDAWPLPDAELHVPISVRDVPSAWWGPTPPLEQWQAWVGREPRTLRVTQPDWFDAPCTRQVGLRTDYTAALPAPLGSEQPYPKDGLAVSPPQPIERIDVIAPESAEMQPLIPKVLEVFNKGERAIENNYGHPIAKRAREGRAPDVEAIYAFGEHPRIYYIEAVRPYRRLGQTVGECTAVAFGTIWFSLEGSQVRELDSAVDLLPCNRAGASYMLPLGVIRANGKPYWLAQFASFDHERYAVIDIKPKTVAAVVNVSGGSCQR